MEKLEIPKLESALDYRLWHKTINIKYENTISIPAKQLFVQKLKKSIAVEAVYSDIQHMTSAKAIVTTVAREIGSLQKLNKDAEAKLKDLRLMALANNRKLTLERQLDAVNLGLKIFSCFENKHADMSKTLVNLLQNSTLVYEWRTEMERIITQQIYSTKDTNIFMKAAMDPDILE